MKPRTLLVLLLLVAGLAAFIWFFERDLPSTDERAERARKVLPIEIDEITAVEIAIGAARTRLEKGLDEALREDGSPEGLTPTVAGEWRLVAPFSARADGDEVEDLLATLTELEKERTLEDFDPAELGLEVPRATVRVAAGDRDWLLQVGEKIPASSSVVVTRGAGEAYVVSDSFWADLDRPAGDWRSRQAFPADREEITSVRFASAAGPVALERRGEGFWIAEPLVDEADEDKVDELLEAVSDLEIEAFLDPPQDLTALGLEPAASVVAVGVGTDRQPIEVRLGSPVTDEGTKVYAAVGEQVFETDTDLPDLLAAGATDWQSKAWTRLEVYEVDSVEVRQGDETLRLERVSGDWQRDGVDIAYTTASDVLYALRDVEPTAVRESSGLDLSGEPLLALTLAAGERAETLTLRAAGGEDWVAERQGRPYVLVLAREDVDAVLEKIDAARTAAPMPTVDPQSATE